jgi:hypothetical protein
MSPRKLDLVTIALALVGGERMTNAQPPPGAAGVVTCPPASSNEPSVACPKLQPVGSPPVLVPTPEPEPEIPWYETLGWSIAVGGGIDDFAHTAMRDATSIGGSWCARLMAGTNSYFALEVAYIGSAQSIQRTGLHSASLIGNGVQGSLRINGTVSYPVQPFVYGGAAWRHYSISTSGENTSDVLSNNDVLEVPVGVGVATYLGVTGLVFDIRGEYRFAWGDDMLPETRGATGALDRWGITGNVGYEF